MTIQIFFEYLRAYLERLRLTDRFRESTAMEVESTYLASQTCCLRHRRSEALAIRLRMLWPSFDRATACVLELQ